jgi:hypothetical protein
MMKNRSSNKKWLVLLAFVLLGSVGYLSLQKTGTEGYETIKLSKTSCPSWKEWNEEDKTCVNKK